MLSRVSIDSFEMMMMKIRSAGFIIKDHELTSSEIKNMDHTDRDSIMISLTRIFRKIDSIDILSRNILERSPYFDNNVKTSDLTTVEKLRTVKSICVTFNLKISDALNSKCSELCDSFNVLEEMLYRMRVRLKTS